jgi:inosine-uridine nucleoside N-ribohydrolase
MQYWIDTDPGVDDALAILFALHEVGNNLVGFSTVQGNVSEAEAAINLGRALSHFEQEGLTPPNWQPRLIRGQANPLLRSRLQRESIHGADGLGEVAWQISPTWQSLLNATSDSLPATLASLDKLCLVCLAPLTNIAKAVQTEPSLVERVEQLVIMGGSLRSGGNTSMAADFNFYADPEAASIVLEAGFRNIKLIPLDAGLSARFTAQELVRLDQAQTPLAKTVQALIEKWRDRITEKGAAIYDLIAWLAVTHPEWVEWQSLYVGVDTAGGLAYGASIADWRNRSGRKPNVSAALGFNGELVWKFVLEVLH